MSAYFFDCMSTVPIKIHLTILKTNENNNDETMKTLTKVNSEQRNRETEKTSFWGTYIYQKKCLEYPIFSNKG